MSLSLEVTSYREGRCRFCGWRVTVDRNSDRHLRDGRWCGPVETEHPFIVSDEPIAEHTRGAVAES